MALLCIIAIANLTFLQFCTGFINDAFITDCKNFFIFNSYMSHTVVEIVTRCKNVVLNCFDCLRSHIRCSKFAGGFALPVFMYFSQLCFGLFSNVERIRCSCCNSIQFILQPLVRKFRECLASSRCDRAASYDQLIITNDNRNIPENVSKSFRASGNHRLPFGSLIGFRNQFCSGRFDHRHLCIKCFDQLRDSG